MTEFLRTLGAGARFRVVLFDTDLHVWKDRLQPLTHANLDAVQRWCSAQHPEGATMLRSAIEHVLRVDSDGKADVEHIEEDTVIVLCDGETTEGPHWIEPLLARVNSDACLAFHCVQIGSAGDGALQRLATLSGGEFAHVD